MKQRNIFILTLVLLSVCLPTFSSTICSAQAAQLSITNVNALLLQTRTVGDREIHSYKIIVLVHNGGSVPSDGISVKFHDPEFNQSLPPMILTPENYSLMPGETKAFNNSDVWPTPLTGNVIINFTFAPTDPSTHTNQYNSGYYLYTLQIGSSSTKKSTPGFEIAVCLIAVVLLLALRKRNK